jgi:CBS domain-containing protein
MQTRDVMTKTVECVPPTASLHEAARKMRQFDVGALPVCDNDRLIGMITDRDIAMRSVAREADVKLDSVKDTMTPHIVYCFDDEPVEEAAAIMRDRQVRRLPVLDRHKRLVGIVSLGDLAVGTDEQMCGNALRGISESANAVS